MKLGPVELPALDVPRLGLAAFRRRLVFHGVFLLLALSTLALALLLLSEERQRSQQRYAQGFRKTLGEVAAQLRHPAGQLALLNPGLGQGPEAAQVPLRLPYAAIDFDDPNKARQAMELAGCGVRWRNGDSLCVAVGSNAYAGGFVYLVGLLDTPPLQPREQGSIELSAVHRARVSVDYRGQVSQWVAPFERLERPEREPGAARPEPPEATPAAAPAAQRGRLTGFVDHGDRLEVRDRPVRDFRGWLWQEGPCIGIGTSTSTGTSTTASTGPDTRTTEPCRRRTLISIRLPVEVFREALFARPAPAWPPADLAQMRVRLRLLPPGDAAPLFDSTTPGAAPAFTLHDLRAGLAPGETLRIEHVAGSSAKATGQAPAPITLRGASAEALPAPHWLLALIRRLPGADAVGPLQATDTVDASHGRYRLVLDGSLEAVDQGLAATATRLSWIVGAMLAAIGLAWLTIEVGLIRRVAVLTRRAAAVSYNMQDPQVDRRLGDLNVADLRGKDELGILAGSLADLLQRVKDSLRREHIRAEQERDMWHAVGHEIMSPLQSLMVLHGDPADPSHRYVQRMQQAVRVLYGTASPGEAIESATLEVGTLELDEFLRHVADNAHFAGIEGVHYASAGRPVPVRAEAYSLEDVVTHVMRNADRYRPPGTPITLSLDLADDTTARVRIHNPGPAIAPDAIERIFEYGVTDPGADDSDADPQRERRGQGLFVARTYMAKMGGTIRAENVEGGVVFTLGLARAA